MRLKKYYFKRIKSTNDQATQMIKKGKEKGIIIADLQTKGRGRYGKKWISQKGNLFMTVFYKINKEKNLNFLTNYNCRLVKSALKKFINKKITIKPPNDLLINNKKLCGILQETIFFKLNKLIIVGIGVNIIKSPNIKGYKTTFLNDFTAKKINKMIVFKSISKLFEKNIRFL